MEQPTHDRRKKKYVAVMRSSAVRDAQACRAQEPDLMDEDTWYDVKNPQLYLGIYEGAYDKVLGQAAAYALTHTDNIMLIEV